MTAPQLGLATRLGPAGIAAIVTCALILFGIGAIVFPALTDGVSESNSAQPAAPATTGEESSAPPPSPTTAAAPTSQPSMLVAANFNTNYEDRVVQLVNSERRKKKCEPVQVNVQLRNAARAHSADMATNDFTGRKGSDDSMPEGRATVAGYNGWTGELTAKGGDAGDVVKGWLRDDNDREILVDCGITSIGVGAAMRGRTAYWTVDTGRA